MSINNKIKIMTKKVTVNGFKQTKCKRQLVDPGSVLFL